MFKLKLNISIIRNILSVYYKKKGLDDHLTAEKCRNLFIEFLRGDLDAKHLCGIIEKALMTILSEKYDADKM